MSPIHLRVEGFGGGGGTLESHLEHLTPRILGMRMNEIPLELQVYTVGVAQRMMKVLRRIASAILFYHEHYLVEDISD